MNLQLPVNRKKSTEIVTQIAERVLNGWGSDLSLCIGNLDDNSLMELHQGIINSIPDSIPLTPEQTNNLHGYVTALPRMHRGFFWKFFNFYHKKLSEAWYLGNKHITNLIMNSLVCYADKKSIAYQAQVLSLYTVCDYVMEEV